MPVAVANKVDLRVLPADDISTLLERLEHACGEDVLVVGHSNTVPEIAAAFGAKPFVKVVRRYGLDQEYITPYTPEQNGMIERFFGSLKSECVWLHRFRDRDHAFREIATWIDHYHDERPHSALGYLTPKAYREKLAA